MKKLLRRIYIRFWLSWHAFCKHGHSLLGFDECENCAREKRNKKAARDRRDREQRYVESDKAERLVKEL